MNKSICFVTTGDIAKIATAKRALGLANPLADLGWQVSILMEDCAENRHRVSMECDMRIDIRYFPAGSMMQERRAKDALIRDIGPDFLYICAFVTRNIVGLCHRSKKLVEHSELQTGIPDMKGQRKWFCYVYEFYSILYGDGLLNASKYLQNVYQKRAKKLLKRNMPMLYYPYAYNKNIIELREIDYNNSKFAQYQDKKIFVFLGSIVRNYGAFTIIDATKALKQAGHNDFKVLMFGRGRHYNEAVKYVKDQELQDIIELPGYIAEEEIADYFSLADAFISPMNDTVQDWARCPSKLYMYLPYLKPIITCRIGEPYEVLGQEGLYFKPGSPEGLSQAMLKVIDGTQSCIRLEPMQHEWTTRAKELNNWINMTF